MSGISNHPVQLLPVRGPLWFSRVPRAARSACTPSIVSTSSAVTESLILFDQYSRYAGSVEVLRPSLRANSTVLDVGSGHGRLLGPFLPEATVSFLDPLLTGETSEHVIPGKIDQLSQTDRRWDWTVAVDTLEHIPAAERVDFVDTLVSLARDGVLIAGPFREDQAALAVDATVNETYRKKTGKDYPWLEEHTSYTLPSISEVRERLENSGFVTATYGNGHAPWLEALLPFVICYLDAREHLPLVRSLSSLFNDRLYRFDHLEPVYRRILIARRGRAPAAVTRLEDTPQVRREASVAWSSFWNTLVAKISEHSDELVHRLRDANPEGADVESERALAADLIASEAEARLLYAERGFGEARRELAQIKSTLSWRVTEPFRAIKRRISALLHPAPRARGGTGAEPADRLNGE